MSGEIKVKAAESLAMYFLKLELQRVKEVMESKKCSDDTSLYMYYGGMETALKTAIHRFDNFGDIAVAIDV